MTQNNSKIRVDSAKIPRSQKPYGKVYTEEGYLLKVNKWNYPDAHKWMSQLIRESIAKKEPLVAGSTRHWPTLWFRDEIDALAFYLKFCDGGDKPVSVKNPDPDSVLVRYVLLTT